jgi:hypothetical protein
MSRSRLLLGLVVLIVALAFNPAPAAAQTPIPNPIDIIGGDDNDKEKDKEEQGHDADECATIGVTCAAEQVIDVPQDAASEAIANAGESVMSGVTNWVANGASWLLRQVANLAEKTTTPRLDSKWFGDKYADMMVLAAPLVAVLLMLSMIEAALRRDPNQVVRSFVALPVAFLLAGGILVVFGLLITATDAWSAWLLRSFDDDAREVYQNIAGAALFSGLSGRLDIPLFIVFLTALVTALCAIGVWIELLLREAAIYVAAFFIPLTYAGAVWRRSEPWVARSTEFLVAVILAKLPIAGALALGAAAMAHSGEEGAAAAVGGVLAGAAVIGFAALSPWLLLKMFPLAREAMGSGMHQRAALPAGSTIVRGFRPATAMKSAMAANWAAGAAGGLAVAGAAAATRAVTGRGRNPGNPGDDEGGNPGSSTGPRGGQERQSDPASRLRGNMADKSGEADAGQQSAAHGSRGDASPERTAGGATPSNVQGLPPKDAPTNTGLEPPPEDRGGSPPPPRPPDSDDPSRRSI